MALTDYLSAPATYRWPWVWGGDVTKPEVKAAMADVGAKCRAAGVPLGTVMPTPEMVLWAYSVGFSFVSHASDLGLLMGAARANIAKVHELLGNDAKANQNKGPTAAY